MTRTTLDLDAGVLRALKRRKQKTGQSLGNLRLRAACGRVTGGAGRAWTDHLAVRADGRAGGSRRQGSGSARSRGLMTYAVDVNLLLYASDEGSPWHEPAVKLIDEIALGPEIAYLFWPTVMAYLRIATHPAVFQQPLPHRDARANIQGLLDLPHVPAVGEQDNFWQQFAEVADDVMPTGNLVRTHTWLR